MGDDAHRVTFDDLAFDRRCWGSGATGQGCGREAILPVGLCASCHDEISQRAEKRAERRTAVGQRRIVEIDVEVNCVGGGVTSTPLLALRTIASWDGLQWRRLEDPPDGCQR